ncbi:hypothetical protein [Planobispora takensis]|uniref:hypothetical protein n=1 Tax=Planobispora takensis TaxID=1367882 RepID=UPI001944FEE4|nr:hypothetical protein [Planobispora takensis]
MPDRHCSKTKTRSEEAIWTACGAVDVGDPSNRDATVARKKPDDPTDQQLVDQARAEDVELVGENGPLGRLTELVPESAQDGMTDPGTPAVPVADPRGIGAAPAADIRQRQVPDSTTSTVAPRSGSPAQEHSGYGARQPVPR